MDILVFAFLLKELGGVLGILYWTDFELIAEIRRGGWLLQAAGAVLPWTIWVCFAPQDDVVSFCRAEFQVIKAGKEFYRFQLVTGVSCKQVPGTFVVALFVVGNAFFGVVIMFWYISVSIVRIDIDPCRK